MVRRVSSKKRYGLQCDPCFWMRLRAEMIPSYICLTIWSSMSMIARLSVRVPVAEGVLLPTEFLCEVSKCGALLWPAKSILGNSAVTSAPECYELLDLQCKSGLARKSVEGTSL